MSAEFNAALSGKIIFEQMIGVGTMELMLKPNQSVYVFIGENGVGKTKLLESLFAFLFFHHQILQDSKAYYSWRIFNFETVSIEGKINNIKKKETNFSFHNFPVLYLAAQNRLDIEERDYIERLSDKENRLEKYLEYLNYSFIKNGKVKSLNMDIDISAWIIQRAQSANPYQALEDNREVEIKTLLKLLNQLDNRVAEDFLEISGNRVFLKIDNQKRALTELSSGFTSILKILQSIISGYGAFTNAQQLENVRGYVLIDEIESHLHHQWQVKIVPLLKQLFPNTIFFIATHSAVVLSQLQHGEAYRLVRDEDGIVRSNLIDYPAQTAMVDLLHDAFDLNLTAERRKWLGNQQEAKSALNALLSELD